MALVAVLAPVPERVPDTITTLSPTAKSTLWVQESVRTKPPPWALAALVQINPLIKLVPAVPFSAKLETA